MLSDIDSANNLVELFLKRADEKGDFPFLGAKREGEWQTISWREAADRVCLLAEGLRGLGLRDGDRVCLVSENRPEWCIADLAIMAAGCITVPAYITNTERDHVHILDNSGAKAVIVSTEKLLRPLHGALQASGVAEHVIGIEDLHRQQSGSFSFHKWDRMLEGDPAAARKAVDTRIAGISRSDTACIIYTSGTGGAPRGVLQHHGAILCNSAGAAEILIEDFGIDQDERFLSFLPLSHAYEHTGGQFLPIGVGAQIYYAEGLEKLASNIEETRPTIMVVVPRLFEVLRTRIMKQIRKQGGIAETLMDTALEVGERRAAGERKLGDGVKEFAVARLLKPKIRQRFGGRIKAMVSGGAPLNPEVGIFFEAMGLTMLQGYGQTEAGPVISCNRPAAGIAMHSVGPAMRGVEIRIAEDGEILVRGELVMHGYWQNESETERTIKDGWLHTGDIGHLDDQGRIVITDRKKDIIVNSGGENIAPGRVEALLTIEPEIEQVMVDGDKRPWLSAVIVPSEELRNIATSPDALYTMVGEAVDRANSRLSQLERVRRFLIADEAFTIDNGQMTATLKVRRHIVRDIYGERLDELYPQK